MNDDDDMIDLLVGSNGGCYIESLMRSRRHLIDSPKLLEALDTVIEAELELALMGADKARSEILKLNKDNIVSLK
jgi:hypothetical protein